MARVPRRAGRRRRRRSARRSPAPPRPTIRTTVRGSIRRAIDNSAPPQPAIKPTIPVVGRRPTPKPGPIPPEDIPVMCKGGKEPLQPMMAILQPATPTKVTSSEIRECRAMIREKMRLETLVCNSSGFITPSQAKLLQIRYPGARAAVLREHAQLIGKEVMERLTRWTGGELEWSEDERRILLLIERKMERVALFVTGAIVGH
ncbi:hypothetical protein MMC30_001339 [Trapelia coarctata]|nr:hypothetical protein [Trapelia coarctata]